MKIGIVGHGSNKFTKHSEQVARNVIRKILSKYPNVIAISGHSPVGGIDIWTEEVAHDLGLVMDIKSPKTNSWDGDYGYKARNLDIARSSDEVHVILVNKYPPNYNGMRFDNCYHCSKHLEHKISNHVKSGGCWTGHEANKLGKEVIFHIIKN